MTKKATGQRGSLFGGVAARFLAFGNAGFFVVTAAERTGINLGTTSFFDGFAGTEPGCTYIQFSGHDAFTTFNGPDGSNAFDAHLELNYAVPQFTCSSPYKSLGGTPGLNSSVPISEQSSNFFSTNGFGAGDALTGPYIQFPPLKSNGRDVFSHGFEFDIITATGKYNGSRTIGPGNDFWSINPFWKGTWLPASSLEVSWRLD